MDNNAYCIVIHINLWATIYPNSRTSIKTSIRKVHDIMRPFKQINIGDIYQRLGQHIEWTVVDKDYDEKMIELMCSYQHPTLPTTVWKSNRNAIFNRRVYP